MSGWRVGIDEAGRGCVIGPLVFGAYAIPLEQADALAELGPRDSKALTHGQRVQLREALTDFSGRGAVLEFSARTLDDTNLGELTNNLLKPQLEGLVHYDEVHLVSIDSSVISL